MATESAMHSMPGARPIDPEPNFRLTRRIGEESRRHGETSGRRDRQASAPPLEASAPVRGVEDVVRRGGRRLAAVAMRPLYAVYTRRLRREVLARQRPRHVAVIMDGNRRWAIREGFADHRVGHRRGAEKALELIDWCAELGIREVTSGRSRSRT